MGAWDTANLGWQRLIERLNAREAGLAESRVGQRQLSREELEAEFEKERQRNYVCMALAQAAGSGQARVEARPGKRAAASRYLHNHPTPDNIGRPERR
jgi:hypothetical protein